MKDGAMKLVINDPNNLKRVDYKKIKESQHNLKDLSEINYNKLKASIEKQTNDYIYRNVNS